MSASGNSILNYVWLTVILGEPHLTNGFSFVLRLVLNKNPNGTTGLYFLNKLSFRKRRKLRLKLEIGPNNLGLYGQDTYSVTKGFLGHTATINNDLGCVVTLLNKELLNSRRNRLEQGLHT